MNQVAEQVEKEFPNVWIETLAYQYTRKPPKMIPPRHNVVPSLCTIECDFSLPLDKSPYPQNVRFVEHIRAGRPSPTSCSCGITRRTSTTTWDLTRTSPRSPRISASFAITTW